MSVSYHSMAASASEDSAFVELRLRAPLSSVRQVRRFVRDLYLRVLDDEEIASRLLLASHELLENAIKCSIDEEATLRIEVRKRDAARELTVSTRNRSRAEDIVVLRRFLDEMAAQPDAFTHYQKLLRMSALRPTGSGLGLARVRAEAEMHVHGEIEDDRVTIVARAQVAA